MAGAFQMKLDFRRVPNNSNMFEFAITTPLLKAQFLIRRSIVNRLSVDLERALIKK